MTYLKRLLRRLVLWAIEDDLIAFNDNLTRNLSNACQSYVSRATTGLHAEARRLAQGVRSEVAALQALDVDFHKRGKVIIVARIGGRDIVKVIDVCPEWKVGDYRKLVLHVEQVFGAQLRWLDAPGGCPSQDYFRGRI